MSEGITDHLDVWTSALLTKSAAGRGSNGKLEAYGIKKLRELILATALRGLFDRSNEPLPKTIEQDVRNARNSYYKKIGKKPKEYVFGPALLEEFDLPSGWAWKRVADLCDLQTGATPNTQNPRYFGGEVRWLVSGDINQGVIEDCEGRITEEGLASSNCKILPPKTVLIALNGQGKTRASVALLNVPAACNQSLVGMIPFDAYILDPAFLLLSLRYRYYEIRDITGQNQRRGLNMGLVAELSIPLPPLAEQHRIVAKVDELMVLCDQLEQQQTDNLSAHQTLVETLLGALTRVESQQEFSAAWARIVSHFDMLFTTEASIDQLKQTILQLAVMGKLVPQDPHDESAQELYDRIQRTRAVLVKNGTIKRISIEPNPTEDDCESLPSGWLWSRLGAVFDVRDGTHDTPKYTDEGFPLITSKNIYTGSLSFEGAKFISEKDHRQINERSRVDRGDILFAMIGSIGNPVIVDTDREFSIKNVALFKYLDASDAEPRFLLLYLSLVAEEMREKAAGGVQSFVSLGFLRNYPFPLPPLNEQRRIVAKVDELMALSNALKASIADATATQAYLADAIVQQAIAEKEAIPEVSVEAII